MPALTAAYVVERALRLFGRVGVGQPALPEDLNDGRNALNDMISLWRTKSLTIPYDDISQYNLISSQQDYTLGPGGDFSQARPTFIRGIGLVLLQPSRPTELQLELITCQAWPTITIKTQPSTFPTCVYAQMKFPLIVLRFWPVPTETNAIRIYSPMVLSSFADLSTSYDVPDGYGLALIYSLARLLAPEYGLALTQEQINTANDAMTFIGASNVNMDILTVDRALQGMPAIYNWRTDQGAGGGGR